MEPIGQDEPRGRNEPRRPLASVVMVFVLCVATVAVLLYASRVNRWTYQHGDWVTISVREVRGNQQLQFRDAVREQRAPPGQLVAQIFVSPPSRAPSASPFPDWPGFIPVTAPVFTADIVSEDVRFTQLGSYGREELIREALVATFPNQVPVLAPAIEVERLIGALNRPARIEPWRVIVNSFLLCAYLGAMASGVFAIWLWIRTQ